MKQELRTFLAAIQYFTRIPVPAWVGHAPDRLAQTTRYLPAVGLVVGLVAAAILWLSAHLLPVGIAVILSIAAGIMLTGAFHEDGLSDFADGLAGSSKERALAIMKDSRVGVYGVITLVLALLLKYETLVSLAGKHSAGYAAVALIAGHAISRAIAVSIMLTLPYARTDNSSKAKPAIKEFGYQSALVALPVAILVLGLLLAAGAQFHSLIAALAVGLMVRIYLAWQFEKRLGGYTGDCLGATQQLSELGFYLGLMLAL